MSCAAANPEDISRAIGTARNPKDSPGAAFAFTAFTRRSAQAPVRICDFHNARNLKLRPLAQFLRCNSQHSPPAPQLSAATHEAFGKSTTRYSALAALLLPSVTGVPLPHWTQRRRTGGRTGGPSAVKTSNPRCVNVPRRRIFAPPARHSKRDIFPKGRGTFWYRRAGGERRSIAPWQAPLSPSQPRRAGCGRAASFAAGSWYSRPSYS